MTFAPESTIATLVTMKMMRRTRKMSVSGVMLISAMMWQRPRPPAGSLDTAIRDTPGYGRLRSRSRTQRLEQARAADRERRFDAVETYLEVVVGNERDDGDEKPERRGDERLRDAAGDNGEAAAAHDGHA